jgi:hypothetical protein
MTCSSSKMSISHMKRIYSALMTMITSLVLFCFFVFSKLLGPGRPTRYTNNLTSFFQQALIMLCVNCSTLRREMEHRTW